MKVSVVIATYKASDYLHKAISSALAQTWQDYEIIVSDDAADLEVRRMAESFSDRRIRYRSNGKRLGPAGNHWAAFADANGDLVSVLNHDDLWNPAFLQKLCPAFNDPEVVVAFCDHDIIDEHGDIQLDQTNRNTRHWGRDTLVAGPHKPFAHFAARGTMPIAMGAVIRRKVLPSIETFDPGGAYDLHLSQQLACSGGSAFYVPERLTAWRLHGRQLTSNPDFSWRNGTLICYREMLRHPAFAYCRKDVKRRLSDAEHDLGRYFFSKKEYGSVVKHALEAILFKPFRIRTYGMLAIATAKNAMQMRKTPR